MPDRSLIAEFSTRLCGLSDQELETFFEMADWFTDLYASGCELEGHVFLVLDNNMIQHFKHRDTERKRALSALAYTAFCRIVSGWSDRPTTLAISPVAIYEHVGKRSLKTPRECVDTLHDVFNLIRDTRLQVATVGFRTPQELHDALFQIAADDRYLAKYIAELDRSNWQLDLQDDFGVKIPLGIAMDRIPDDLPLQYFDPWYVKSTLSARIEQHIVKQSDQNPDAMPVSSGEQSIALADLNEITRRGMLKGLGDIDLLQLCDLGRQYQQRPEFIMVGQTLDRGLIRALRSKHHFIVSGTTIDFGHPNKDQQIEDAVSLKFSNPFANEEKRGRHIRAKLLQGLDALAAACREALGKPKH